jgi:hypothetical protein
MIIPAYNTIYSRVNTSGSAGPLEYTAIDNNFSMEFDGTNYIDCGTLPYFTTPQTSFSISFWFNLNTLAGMPFSIGDKIYFIVESTRIQCWNIGATTGRADTTAVIYTTGNWFHFACAYNGAWATDTDKFKVWINGVPNTLNFISPPPTSTAGTNRSTRIGNFYTGTSYLINGNIDEVSVWNTPLSERTIEAIYNTTNDNPGKAADLSETPEGVPIAWYRMGD